MGSGSTVGQPTRGIGDILKAVIDHFQGRMEEERYGSRSRRGGRTAPGSSPGQALVAGGKAGLFEG